MYEHIFRDVGGYPRHRTGTWGFPRPGGAATDGADSTSEAGRKFVVHLGRGGERGVGVWSNGNLYSTKSEYGCVMYCDADDYGPMRGGREEAGSICVYEVVLTGGNWTGRGKGGGGGGRGRYGGIKKGEGDWNGRHLELGQQQRIQSIN